LGKRARTGRDREGLGRLLRSLLAFGQTATSQFSGTASLYAYFGSTVVILILVSMLPPNRSDRWLGGRNEGTNAPTV
jgi:hypothetical protein